jgi:hypothetical protein
MKLYNYYTLDECTNKKGILRKLKELEKEGKIEFEVEKSTDVITLEDLDLEDTDIEELVELFEENDVYPYLDKDDDDDDDYDGGYYDDEDEY